jgi:hypothetical protein
MPNKQEIITKYVFKENHIKNKQKNTHKEFPSVLL